MHVTEFIPADWLEHSAGRQPAANAGLLQPARRRSNGASQTRRTSDVELLLKSLLLAKAA